MSEQKEKFFPKGFIFKQPHEEWRDIDGFEGMYQVSSFGRVRSLDRIINRYCYKSRKVIDIPLKGALRKEWTKENGYKAIKLSARGVTKAWLIHRLVASAFLPNPENKPCVNHKNGIKSNNKVENIEWATYKENSRHACTTGLLLVTDEMKEKISKAQRGELGNSAILTEGDVLKIRETAKKRGYQYGIKEMMKQYGVTRGTISDVVQRKTWKHL